jgi:hypothetical protein
MFSRRQIIGMFAGHCRAAICGFTPAVADTPAYEVVSDGTWTPGTAIPTPTGPIILRISGKIAAASNGEVAFDMASLESLGVVRYTTPTNWTDGPATFEGVLLSKVLEAIGADPSATTLTMVALNDYRRARATGRCAQVAGHARAQRTAKYMSVRDHAPIWVVSPAPGCRSRQLRDVGALGLAARRDLRRVTARISEDRGRHAAPS